MHYLRYTSRCCLLHSHNILLAVAATYSNRMCGHTTENRGGKSLIHIRNVRSHHCKQRREVVNSYPEAAILLQRFYLNFSMKIFQFVTKILISIINQADIYLPKVNNRNTRTRCEICSKLTIKTPEGRQWRLIIMNRFNISC